MKIERQDTVRTCKDLLIAATDIFAEKGFRDATIAEISQRAGANIASVNYHFGDKETLYREAWRQSFRDSIEAHPPDGGVEVNAPPEQRLKGQVTALLRRITDKNNKGFLIANKELANPTGLLEEVMREEIRPLRRRIMALVREILGPDKSEMEVRFCTLSMASQCVIPAFTNMVEKPETEGETESLRIDDIEAYAEHVVVFSLAGMAAIRGSVGESGGPERSRPRAVKKVRSGRTGSRVRAPGSRVQGPEEQRIVVGGQTGKTLQGKENGERGLVCSRLTAHDLRGSVTRSERFI